MKDFKAELDNLFDEKTMKTLCGCLKIKEDDHTAEFRSDLVAICAHYRLIISTLPCDLLKGGAPFNLSLTKRADWLEVNVINPARKLLEAVDPGNRPYFSTWPYPLDPPKFRDNEALCIELRDFVSEAEALRDSLRGQQLDDAGHSQEIRMEVFASLARLFRKHAPNVPPNRGVYNPDKRQRYGAYVDAMRLAFAKITGADDNLDRLIRGEMHLPS